MDKSIDGVRICQIAPVSTFDKWWKDMIDTGKCQQKGFVIRVTDGIADHPFKQVKYIEKRVPKKVIQCRKTILPQNKLQLAVYNLFVTFCHQS